MGQKDPKKKKQTNKHTTLPRHFQMMEIQLVSKHQRDHLQKHRKKGHNNTYIKTEVSSPKKNENTLIQRSAPNVS
jgi:hypothetical protein